MTVDKLSRLLPALGQSAQNTTGKKSESTENQAAQSAPSEAVAFADSFGSGAGDTGEVGRREKVEQLKKAVAAGAYRPDSYQVAESLARDLLV